MGLEDSRYLQDSLWQDINVNQTKVCKKTAWVLLCSVAQHTNTGTVSSVCLILPLSHTAIQSCNTILSNFIYVIIDIVGEN